MLTREDRKISGKDEAYRGSDRKQDKPFASEDFGRKAYARNRTVNRAAEYGDHPDRSGKGSGKSDKSTEAASEGRSYYKSGENAAAFISRLQRDTRKNEL